MIDFVHIGDIDGLDRLREALVRYGSDLDNALAQASGEIDRTLGYLGDRFSHWRRQLDIWTSEAAHRWRRLERCENQVCEGRWDRKTIHRACGALYEEWREAESRRRHAEDCVEQLKGLIRAVEQTRDAFDRDARRIQSSLHSTLPRAQNILGQTASRARALAAHQYSGVGLARAGTIFSGSRSGSSGAEAGVARTGAAATAVSIGRSGTDGVDALTGMHAPASQEGEVKESEPGPEAGEGVPRRRTDAPPRQESSELDPPHGGSKEGGF